MSTLRCPHCLSYDIHHSRRKGPFEILALRLLLLRPFRCWKCCRRYYRFAFQIPNQGAYTMTDITTPMIIDDIALHLRTCAVLVADPLSAEFLVRCAHQLDQRAEEMREHAQPPRIKTSDVPPLQKP